MASSDRKLDLYRAMARIRAFENAAEDASRGSVAAFGASLAQSDIRGPLHLSTGQEAVAAGVCINLGAEDFLTSTHRGHGHTLAKGASMDAMMAELFGRASGPNHGKGGSMHLADFSVGMLGANGVVAAGMPIAVGAAHAVKIKGETRVVACFFGDGAVNRGPFLEALNWAAIHALPILFVCEDNRWSATTATDTMTAGEGALPRARALGGPGVPVAGNDGFCRGRGGERAAETGSRRTWPAISPCSHLSLQGACVRRRGQVPRRRRSRQSSRERPAAHCCERNMRGGGEKDSRRS